MDEGRGRIAVIGGGTAGWLAALVLKRNFDKKNKPGTQPEICVIESPNIPTIGVGEGSTSVFRQVLLDLDIDEHEFLKQTGATIKFGIKHENWSAPGSSYFGPIDDPNQLVPTPDGAASNWLHISRFAAGRAIEDAHLFTWLMRGRKSPVATGADGAQIPTSPFHHAFHFDQAKLGRFLATKAEGITHIRAEVKDVTLTADSGHIDVLQLDGHEDLPVDFVIDCTGFRRAIISKLGVSWHSYADFLPLNKAIPFWLDHNETQDIAPYTLARALSSGWMWGIPTADRVGCGYVFSDAHLTPEQAVDELNEVMGQQVEPRALIPINPGRLEQAWIKNCVAIGLAQSFLEPLEATSIHGSLVQLLMLCQTSAADLLSGSYGKDQQLYNKIVAGQVDDFAHFINLHYAGGRKDTDFWLSMTDGGIHQAVRDRLAVWQDEPVQRRHFPAFAANLPHVEEQLHVPVLDGLGLVDQGPSKAYMQAHKPLRAQARKTLENLIKEFRRAAQKSMGHRAFLEAL